MPCHSEGEKKERGEGDGGIDRETPAAPMWLAAIVKMLSETLPRRALPC